MTILVLALIALLALALAGCGGSSKASTASTASDAGTQKPVRSKPFLGESGENFAALFGHESDAAELAEARKVLRENLEARAHRQWADQCATLSLKARDGTKTLSKCATRLKRGASEVPAWVLKNNMVGAVGALRVEGNFAYALYHGTDKKNWAMPMEREGGEWKVGALAAEELV